MASAILTFTKAQGASALSPVDVGVHSASTKNERMPSQSLYHRLNLTLAKLPAKLGAESR